MLHAQYFLIIAAVESIHEEVSAPSNDTIVSQVSILLRHHNSADVVSLPNVSDIYSMIQNASRYEYKQHCAELQFHHCVADV